MTLSRFKSNASIVILAAFLLLSPNFGHTAETPTETPTEIPTPTPIPHLAKIQTLDIDSQSIGAIHPQTGDLYVGYIENFSIYHPNSSGMLTRSGSRTIGWSFWDYITIAEDSSVFASSLYWEDFMAHSTNGKSYTLKFDPQWTGSLVHAVCSTDNIPGASVGDVLILKHSGGPYNYSAQSIWRINYREQKVERFPFIPADRLPPNIVDWAIGPENKLHFLTSFPIKIFRLETDGSIRELNHHTLPFDRNPVRFDFLPADGYFYLLTNNSIIYRISCDFQQWEEVFSNETIHYSSMSDIIAGKDGRTLYLLRPSVRKMDVLRYKEPPPTPTPTVENPPTPIAGLFALNGYGEVHAIQSDIEPPTFPLFDADIARDIEPDPKGRGWYTIDGYGNVYRSSDELPPPDYAPVFNFDIVRNLEIKEKNGQLFFYILDGWGGVHTSDPDFSQQGLPYFLGEDIIRDLEPDPSTDGWLTIDIYGNVYSTYGVVPTAEYARPDAYDIPLGRATDGNPALQAMIRLPNDFTIVIDSLGNTLASAYMPPYQGFEEYRAPVGKRGPVWDVEVIPEWQVPTDYAVPTSTPTPSPTPLPEIAMTLYTEFDVQGAIQSLHRDANKKKLLIGKQNGDLDVHDALSWQFERRIQTGRDDLVSAFFAPNGKWIYAGFQDGTIEFINIITKEVIKTIELNSLLHCMTIGKNPDVIFAGLDKGQSVLIDAETGEVTKRFFHYEGEVPASVAIGREGLTLYLGTKDRIFQYSRLNQTVNVFEQPGIDIQASPYKEHLWTLGKSLVLFDPSTQTVLTQEPVDGNVLKISPDGNIVAVGSDSGVVSIRHPDFDSLHQWNAHDGRVTALEFTDSGTGIISVGEDGVVRVWTHPREYDPPTPTPTPELPFLRETVFHEKVLAERQGLREAIAVQQDTGDIYITAIGILFRVKQPKNLVDDSPLEVVGTVPTGYEMIVEKMAVTSNGTIVAADWNKDFLLIQYPNENRKKITFPTLDENLHQTTIQSIYVAPRNIPWKNIKKDNVLAVVYTQGSNSVRSSRIWRIDTTQNDIQPELLFETGYDSFTIYDITDGPENRIYLLTNGPRRIFTLDDSGKLVEYTHFVFESLSGFNQLSSNAFTYLHGDRSFYLSASACIFRLLGMQQNMYRIENLDWGEIADEMECSPDGEWLYYIDKGNDKLVGLKVKDPLPVFPVPTESQVATPTATPIPGWMVLDGYGGIHLTNPDSSRPNLPYFMNFDIARDIEPDPLDRGWFMLDGYGGIHSSSPDLVKPDGMPYFGFDIARDVEFRAAPDNSLYYYVLDGFGVVHTNDPTFERGYLPTFTSDKARSLEPNSINKGWMMMDNEATVYFDYMPWYDLPLNAKMRWEAKAKSLIRFRNQRSIILDGYGGQHINDYYPPHETIQGLPEGFYFPGWDILWDVEIEK